MLPQLADRNRLGLLAGSTIMLQLAVIVTGLLFKLSLPLQQVDLAPDAEAVPAETSADAVVLSSEPADDFETDTVPGPEAPLPDDAAGPKVLGYRVRAGDTLGRIWEEHGAPPAGSILAARAFKEANVPLGALRAGEELEIQLSPGGDITALRKKLTDGRELILDGDSSRGYKAVITKPELTRRERVVSGTIVGSFSAAARRAEIPGGLVDDLVDLFSARVEFRKELHPGDVFSVVFDEVRSADGVLIKAGPIKAASLEKAGRRLFALRHVGKNGKAAYYDQDGRPLGDSFLRYPLQFSRISSAFSYGRFHPILKKTLPHNGIDFAAPLGTQVRSVADGVVAYAGYNFGGGKTVKIKHNDRYTTAYLHLHNFAPGIRKGAVLSRGQLLGTVGSTGLSTGPHLHFSFYDRGRYVNPLKADLPSNTFGTEPIPPKVLQARLEQLIQSQEPVRLAAAQDGGRDS